MGINQENRLTVIIIGVAIFLFIGIMYLNVYMISNFTTVDDIDDPTQTFEASEIKVSDERMHDIITDDYILIQRDLIELLEIRIDYKKKVIEYLERR